MELKENDKQLVKKFWMKNKTGQDSYGIAINNAKIAVDEVIDIQEASERVYGDTELFIRDSYWQEVKAELNQM